MKIAFICTVFNEEKSIEALLKSLESQSLKPNEVIISDGGSSDDTLKKILEFQKQSKLKIKVISAKGNRSVGRNTAIKNTNSEVVAISDAGCTLDKKWLKNIVAPFKDSKVDVVSGYYKGVASSVFQKCLIPYVLVMPDKINPDKFLPATRSMAMRRKVWDTIGNFDEKLDNNEDYAFAKKIKKHGFKIFFQKSAVVSWIPPTSIQKAFIMFYRFAKGDMESRNFRPKVALVFLRYTLGFIFLILAIINKPVFAFEIIIVIFLLYVFWSIFKNYKYIRKQQALLYLPSIQITSDIAVMSGTLKGLWDTQSK